MYRIVETHQSGYVEIVADERDDIQDLPTNYGSGSTCFIIGDSSLWMLGNDME